MTERRSRFDRMKAGRFSICAYQKCNIATERSLPAFISITSVIRSHRRHRRCCNGDVDLSAGMSRQKSPRSFVSPRGERTRRRWRWRAYKSSKMLFVDLNVTVTPAFVRPTRLFCRARSQRSVHRHGYCFVNFRAAFCQYQAARRVCGLVWYSTANRHAARAASFMMLVCVLD